MSLTPEQQCVRLWRFEGWRKVYLGPEEDSRMIDPEGRYSDVKFAPNYLCPLTGLSHLHRVEGLLTDEQHEVFRKWLKRIVREDMDLPDYMANSDKVRRAFVSATEAQRLESLCRTLFPEEMR